MATAAAILEVSHAAVEQRPPHATELWNISFTLKPGELLLVLLEGEHERVPLADAIEGLAIPNEGSVKFVGEHWQTMSPDRTAERRGRSESTQLEFSTRTSTIATEPPVSLYRVQRIAQTAKL